MVQERQQVKNQQSCISVFVAYPKIPSSNWEHQPKCDNSIPYMANGRFIEIQSNFRRKKLHKTNQGPNFLEVVLSIEIIKEL